MEVPANCSKVIKLEDRSDGYLFAMSFNPTNATPTYWGEIELRHGRTATFSYLVHQFDQQGMSYFLSLYYDRQLACPFVSAILNYYGDKAELLTISQLHPRFISAQKGEDIVRATHCIVYECFGHRLPLLQAKNWGIEEGRGIVLGFSHGILPRVIFNKTDIPFLNLISIINRL